MQITLPFRPTLLCRTPSLLSYAEPDLKNIFPIGDTAGLTVQECVHAASQEHTAVVRSASVG